VVVILNLEMVNSVQPIKDALNIALFALVVYVSHALLP
jgi:hypothetical protein